MSPLKGKEDVTLFNGNPWYKIVKLDTLENLHVVPILMNGRDTLNIISTRVQTHCQEDASFIIDLDPLDSREDIYCDDNGIWVATACKSKWFSIERGADNEVVNLTKVASSEDASLANVTVCRSTYHCKTEEQQQLAIIMQQGEAESFAKDDGDVGV